VGTRAAILRPAVRSAGSFGATGAWTRAEATLLLRTGSLRAPVRTNDPSS
jgi:hypothetical protein